MHDSVSDFTRRYRRSLQARANKETAAERTMREYFEAQTLHGMFMDTFGDDVDVRPMLVPAAARNGGASASGGLNTRGATRAVGNSDSAATRAGTSASVPVPPRGNRSGAGIVRNSYPVNNEFIIVPESDDEDWSTDLEESSSNCDEADKLEHHVITRMMYEEANRQETSGRTRHFASAYQPRAARSILDRVRETDDPSPAIFNPPKNVNSSGEGGKNASEGSAKFKGADDAPPNFRWVEIEIK